VVLSYVLCVCSVVRPQNLAKHMNRLYTSFLCIMSRWRERRTVLRVTGLRNYTEARALLSKDSQPLKPTEDDVAYSNELHESKKWHRIATKSILLSSITNQATSEGGGGVESVALNIAASLKNPSTLCRDLLFANHKDLT
jgi:hypothetical protein